MTDILYTLFLLFISVYKISVNLAIFSNLKKGAARPIYLHSTNISYA